MLRGWVGATRRAAGTSCRRRRSRRSACAAFGHGEVVEAGDGERARQLLRAVGAEVEEDDRIARPGCRHGLAVSAGDGDGLDEFVVTPRS
jgi:hypothetical protein